MTEPMGLTPSRKAAWIINASRHLARFEVFDPSLSSFDALLFAGKCGSLLIKLTADDTDQLPRSRVKAHARVAGIAGPVLPVYLNVLKIHNCLDWDSESQIFEVLPFGRLRVLETTAQIFDDSAAATRLERSLPEALEFCLVRPRLEIEMRDFLADFMSDDDLERLIALIEHFDLLGVIALGASAGRLFFNGYQFADRAREIGNAIASLSPDRRDSLTSLLETVGSQPGVPPEDLDVPESILTQALGLGLVEVSEVASAAGSARFLTMPNLSPPSVGSETFHLEDDVFHHAKMFLSSLRYGQFRSSISRGRIISPPVLLRALLRNDRVGPCTAIGEDYTILEAEGVIRTIPADDRSGGQYYMELRRREPARMVLDLVQSGQTAQLDTRLIAGNLQLPSSYRGPEAERPIAARKAMKDDPESFRRFLEELRT